MPSFDHAAACDSAVKILQELVHFPSVNPGLVPGASGETEIAEYICELMRAWGLEVIKSEAAPGRYNAIGLLRGTGGGRTLLFNGHTDTVGVEGMAAPFSGEMRNGKLYGRGAFDMKGSLAATLAAAQALVQSPRRLRGDVIFTFVADEEYTSRGTESIVADIRGGRLPRPDAAINTEPTGLQLGVSHKGFAWIEIETSGKAAHGSRPDLGVDAIVHMGHVLVEIERWQERLSQGRRHPRLGAGSVHASLIHGGRELSSYPDHCRLHVERRTAPPETEQDVADEARQMLEELKRKVPGFQAASRITFARNAWQADLKSEIVKALSRSVQNVLGRAPEMTGFPFWMDTALLGDAGIPSVVFGPAGEGAHAVVEWVDVDSLGVCARVYADVIERFCG